MNEVPSFSRMLSSFLLSCSLGTQADLVDQLFNRAEERLARLLLLMAEWSRSEADETHIPPITQEALANMIGGTRPRVNAFMNRFSQAWVLRIQHSNPRAQVSASSVLRDGEHKAITTTVGTIALAASQKSNGKRCQCEPVIFSPNIIPGYNDGATFAPSGFYRWKLCVAAEHVASPSKDLACQAFPEVVA